MENMRGKKKVGGGGFWKMWEILGAVLRTIIRKVHQCPLKSMRKFGFEKI